MCFQHTEFSRTMMNFIARRGPKLTKEDRKKICRSNIKKKTKHFLKLFFIYSHHFPDPPVRSGQEIKINLVQLLSKLEQDKKVQL